MAYESISELAELVVSPHRHRVLRHHALSRRRLQLQRGLALDALLADESRLSHLGLCRGWFLVCTQGKPGDCEKRRSIVVLRILRASVSYCDLNLDVIGLGPPRESETLQASAINDNATSKTPRLGLGGSFVLAVQALSGVKLTAP
jgi:hypothetical protein